MRDQQFFARAVAVIHAVQLRDGLVAFVEEHERVVRQIVEQRGRRFARQPSGEVARVVFDAVAVADLLDHFEIEHGALLAGAAPRCSLPCFSSSLCHHSSSLRMLCMAPSLRLGRHHVVRLGIDGQPQVGLLHLAGQRIDLREVLDLVAPQFDAIGVVVVGGKELDDVAAHAEGAAAEIGVVALVEDLDQAW